MFIYSPWLCQSYPWLLCSPLVFPLFIDSFSSYYVLRFLGTFIFDLVGLLLLFLCSCSILTSLFWLVQMSQSCAYRMVGPLLALIEAQRPKGVSKSIQIVVEHISILASHTCWLYLDCAILYPDCVFIILDCAIPFIDRGKDLENLQNAFELHLDCAILHFDCAIIILDYTILFLDCGKGFRWPSPPHKELPAPESGFRIPCFWKCKN